MSIKSSKSSSSTMRGLTNWMKSFRGGVTFTIAAIFIVIPIIADIGTSRNILPPLLLIMIFTIFAASWDFLTGFVGQASFGHVIFMGVSIVTYSILVGKNGMEWWVGLLVGALMATLVAFLLGLPLQRMSGPYFAVGTLTLGVVFYLVWLLPELDWLSGGPSGIAVAQISSDIKTVYYITMACMVVSLVVMIAIGKSKTGTILKSIRDDETGAKASGINTLKYKMIAVMISAFFAGIAGGLFAQRTGGAGTSTFHLLYAFIPIIIVMLGGLTTISGSMLGAFIYIIYGEIMNSIRVIPAISANYALSQFFILSPQLIFAVIIMLILGFAPDGLMNPALNKLQKTWDLVAGK